MEDRPPRETPRVPLFDHGRRPERERPQPESHLSTSTFDVSKDKDSIDVDTSSPTAAYGAVPLLSYPNGSSRLRHDASSDYNNPRVQFSSSAKHAEQGASGSGAQFGRKKSLVRPERERVDENHRLFNYRNHAVAMAAEGRGVAGHFVNHDNRPLNDSTNLKRGKSILAREEDMAHETGLSMLKRGATLRKLQRQTSPSDDRRTLQRLIKAKKEPIGPWMMYCYVITFCCPSPLLKCFGLRSKDRQRAWREKIGLLTIILATMAFVGYLTFGFTNSVCGKPPLRYRTGRIEGGSMIYHGYNYDMDKFIHPPAAGINGGTNPLYDLFAAGGKDGSFLFQTVNEKCLDIITPASGSGIVSQGNRMGWYFPCNLYNQYGTSAVNKTGYAEGRMCHTTGPARSQFRALKPLGQVYYLWDDLKNSSRNLGVYNGAVLDFSLLNWLDRSQVNYPSLFDDAKTGTNSTFRGRDITAFMISSGNRQTAACLVDTIRVGFVDSSSIGCVASDIVLYVSLVVIIGVVALRFFMAVLFGWFLSWRIGRFPKETHEQRRKRMEEIENWTSDIYRPAPAKYRPNALKKKTVIPTTSRFSKGDLLPKGGARPDAKYNDYRGSKVITHSGSLSPYSHSKSPSMLGFGMRNSPPGSPTYGGAGKASRSSTSLPTSSTLNFDYARGAESPNDVCPLPLAVDVVPQPPADYEPFNYPLAHCIMLVTAYSESVEGLRTTLDSLATTDYPNSHKLILVIADGMVKGSGNAATTPEIVLGMMKDLIVPIDEVEPHSYVAIADGHKQHNRAKCYAGFYDYDNNTVEMSKQQRVPMILVAKVGNPLEADDKKPGNRGKRDSQIVLMSFLQKVMFDERMTRFEYEFFNSIWRCTGVSPDRYEMVLCVDADTKIFPDSVSRMISCMVHDPEIAGVCGETKIANKTETWVTMIQVFEYHISHHLMKAFESVFGGVTCLPGCFSMFRIKAPKGADGYWVPILANPDIVEHYSENVVDTLHRKNLLLLGEDRYLSTLLLRTFPRRKLIFVPFAVCKTVVPDTFRVLLSQRRRWINSTVHNLFELFIVPDLCGVFCFSMRFVVFMELVGTLVLPAAISFTIYLVIVAIIPGTTKPVLSLILLAIILGLPGILIVVTTRRVAYIGWMLIYLLSLPIWNFVLPAYAFLHMDDFTWGQTRQVAGEGKGGGHGEKEGKFDSSNIVMKRWADWERDRRYKAYSRDLSYLTGFPGDVPRRTGSNRESFVSSAETYASGFNNDPYAGRRASGVGPPLPSQIELPAPLASAPSSFAGDSSSNENALPELPPSSSEESSRGGVIGAAGRGSSRTRATVPANEKYPQYRQHDDYDSDDVERDPILQHGSPQLDSPIMDSAAFGGGHGGMLASPLMTPASDDRDLPILPPPVEPAPGLTASERSTNPFTNMMAASPSTTTSTADSARPQNAKRRGVSLVDDGPVPGTDGFRPIQRTVRRQSTSQQQPSQQQQQQQAIKSRTSGAFSPVESTYMPTGGSLPPGAAPPRH